MVVLSLVLYLWPVLDSLCAFSRSFVYSGTPQVFQAVFAYASSLTLSFGGAVPHVCTLSHLGRSGWQVPFVGVPLCEGELASISISPSCSFSFLCRALPQRFGSVTREISSRVLLRFRETTCFKSTELTAVHRTGRDPNSPCLRDCPAGVLLSFLAARHCYFACRVACGRPYLVLFAVSLKRSGFLLLLLLLGLGTFFISCVMSLVV